MKKLILLSISAIALCSFAKANSWNEIINDDFSSYTNSLDENIYNIGMFPQTGNVIIENEQIKCYPDAITQMLYLAISRNLTDSTLPLRVSGDWTIEKTAAGTDAAFAVGLASNTSHFLAGGATPYADSTIYKISYYDSQGGENILAYLKSLETHTAFSFVMSTYPDSVVLEISNNNGLNEKLKTSWADSVYFPSVSINTQQKDVFSKLYFDNLKAEKIVTTGTDDNISGSGLKLYPSVSSGQISIQGLENGSAMKIYSLTGNMLMQKSAMKNEETIDISELTPGTYIMTVISGNDTESLKFIKE